MNYMVAALIAFGAANPTGALAQSLNTAKPAVGTWTPLANLAPEYISTCLLLSDATVMCLGYLSNTWSRLTPDAKGSYVNGTWGAMAPMHDARLYFQSQVLKNGRVFVSGGEYGTGGSKSEIYDPLTNTWTQTQAPTVASPGVNLFDGSSALLPNGNVLLAPVIFNYPCCLYPSMIFDIGSNTWSYGAPILHNQDEATWVKLADNSLLSIDYQPPGSTSTTTERYIPSLNQWIPDAPVPQQLYDLSQGEIGPGFLLPNGNVFFVGGTNKTAIYTPGGANHAGTWVNGPDIPNNLGANDAPGAMMANGKILLVLGGDTCQCAPSSFYEYDYLTNKFTQVNAPAGGTTLADPSFVTTMLDLPDGSVLFHSFSNQFYTYTPAGKPIYAGAPSIANVTANGDGSYHVTGTGFSGISEGATYGDDWQMATNYPIARLTDANGNVFYCRTYNWSTNTLMTGSLRVGTDMTLPVGLPDGAYKLNIAVNGNPSTDVYHFRVKNGVY